MRKTLTATVLFASLLRAQDAPKQPKAEDLLPVTVAVRDFYRLANQAAAVIAQRDAARQRAQDLKAALEAKFACDLDLDTNVCSTTAKAAVKPEVAQ